MSDTGSNTIMGFIPKNKYTQIAYWLLLASAIGGPVLSLLALLGIYIPLGNLFMLCGLAALIMALAGYFVLKAEFSALEQSHFLYMAVVYGASLLLMFILNSSVYYSYSNMANIVFILVGLAYTLMVWTGFNSWKHGRTITKDNIKSEIQLATKRS